MKQIYFSFLIVLFAFSGAEGQTLKAYQKAAANAEANKNYSAALANYEVIIKEAGKETDYNFYHAAESARMMKIYPLAEEYYQRVLSGTQQADYPMTHYWLGFVLQQQGKYEAAKTAYQQYLTGGGASGGEKAEKAEQAIIDCDWAAAIVLDEKPIDIKHLDQNVNTANTEIAPMLKGDELHFSSLRESHADGFCAFPTTRIYKAKAANESTLLDAGFTAVDKHSAHTTFSADGKTMYYTLCDTPRPDTTHCVIYSRTQKNNGNWGAAQTLPTTINNGKHTATQPNIGVDAESGKELLFFVSDRPGGSGGLDIWCSYKEEDGVFGAAYNVAEINTTGNDITPFFHSELQTLYFSSEGLQNLGGFDIYYAQKEGNGWSSVKHAPYPLNTSYDDIYYVMNTEAKKGHFSSNRPGSICADTSNYCVCNDIYEVRLPVINIIVNTYNEITKEPLNGTNVDLTAPTISDFLTQNRLKEKDHRYQDFEVGFHKSYQLDATKKDYTSSMVSFDTPLPLYDTTIVINHYLRPKVDLDVLTYDKLTGDPLNGVKVELVLMPPVELLASEELASGHEYNYPLKFKNRYMVIGTKTGYSSDTAYVTTDDIPIVPTTLLENLFLCKTLAPFSNVKLYFDNDEPEPDNTRTVTTLSYREAFDAYIKNYDERKGYYKSSKTHTPSMDAFFDEKVRKGYDDLEHLANTIVDYFETAGPSGGILITIKGFASLRSNPKYNRALTSRRISSIRNYFDNWVDDAGVQRLKNYKDRIQITEAPKGDEEACKGCYQKAAITDTKACEDRRVEIIDVIVTKNPCDEAKKPRK